MAFPISPISIKHSALISREATSQTQVCERQKRAEAPQGEKHGQHLQNSSSVCGLPRWRCPAGPQLSRSRCCSCRAPEPAAAGSHPTSSADSGLLSPLSRWDWTWAATSEGGSEHCTLTEWMLPWMKQHDWKQCKNHWIGNEGRWWLDKISCYLGSHANSAHYTGTHYTIIILIIEAITEQSQLMMLYLLNDLGEKFHNNQFWKHEKV